MNENSNEGPKPDVQQTVSASLFSNFKGAVMTGMQTAAGAASEVGQSVSDAAVRYAVSQMLLSVKYASQKIRDADDDLPDDTKLIVSASAAGLVSLSLEAPVKSIKEDRPQSPIDVDEKDAGAMNAAAEVD